MPRPSRRGRCCCWPGTSRKPRTGQPSPTRPVRPSHCRATPRSRRRRRCPAPAAAADPRIPAPSRIAAAALAGSPGCLPSSSGIPVRSGSICSSYAGMASEISSAPGPLNDVRNAPGSTISTRMPNRSTSLASASDHPSSANFVAEYAPTPGNVNRPPMLLIWTIAPVPRSRMPGSTARVSAAGPKKCRSIRSRSSAVAGLLGGADRAAACVVHQHIDAAVPVKHLARRRRGCGRCR